MICIGLDMVGEFQKKLGGSTRKAVNGLIGIANNKHRAAELVNLPKNKDLAGRRILKFIHENPCEVTGKCARNVVVGGNESAPRGRRFHSA